MNNNLLIKDNETIPNDLLQKAIEHIKNCNSKIITSCLTENDIRNEYKEFRKKVLENNTFKYDVTINDFLNLSKLFPIKANRDVRSFDALTKSTLKAGNASKRFVEMDILVNKLGARVKYYDSSNSTGNDDNSDWLHYRKL